jgi:hypothetical protein
VPEIGEKHVRANERCNARLRASVRPVRSGPAGVPGRGSRRNPLENCITAVVNDLLAPIAARDELIMKGPGGRDPAGAGPSPLLPGTTAPAPRASLISPAPSLRSELAAIRKVMF